MSTVQLAGGVVLCAFCALLWIPNLLVLACLIRRPKRREPPIRPSGARAPRLLFLIPAHDEALLIEKTVTSLLRQAYPTDARHVVVVADNCDDRTAEVARQAGAECLERVAPLKRGKPHALAWALERLPVSSFDAVVIIDADTTVEADFAAGLARYAPLSRGVLQGYFGTLNEWETWVTRLAGLLARGKDEVLYPLKDRAGINCPLLGNGMCIGSALLESGWDAFSLTENWELYARYTAAGVSIRYARAARLRAQEARSLGQATTQRKRWQAGRQGVFRVYARHILASPHASWLQKLDCLAELGGPSPVVHLALAALTAGGAVAALPSGAGATIASAALLSLLSLGCTTVLVIFRHPQPFATILALTMLPPYAVWRCYLAVRTALGARPMGWEKTQHH